MGSQQRQLDPAPSQDPRNDKCEEKLPLAKNEQDARKLKNRRIHVTKVLKGTSAPASSPRPLSSGYGGSSPPEDMLQKYSRVHRPQPLLLDSSHQDAEVHRHQCREGKLRNGPLRNIMPNKDAQAYLHSGSFARKTDGPKTN